MHLFKANHHFRHVWPEIFHIILVSTECHSIPLCALTDSTSHTKAIVRFCISVFSVEVDNEWNDAVRLLHSISIKRTSDDNIQHYFWTNWIKAIFVWHFLAEKMCHETVMKTDVILNWIKESQQCNEKEAEKLLYFFNSRVSFYSFLLYSMHFSWKWKVMREWFNVPFIFVLRTSCFVASSEWISYQNGIGHETISVWYEK